MGLGKDTAGDFASDHGGRALGPREIYEQIKNGPGIEDLSDKQDTAAILSSANGDRAKEIEELSKAMDEAWQGDSADQAKAGANPLKDWLREAEDNLYNANLTIYSQSEAYGMAWAGVEDVPDEPPEHGFFGMGKYWPGDTDTDREIAEYNEKAQKNVDAFDTYFNESTANAREMPDYSGHAFDEVGDTIEAGAQFESGPGGNPPGVQGDYAVPSGGTPGGGGVGPDGGGGDPGRVPGGGVTPPGSGGGDGTDPSDHTSPSSPVPGAPGTGPGGGGPGGSPGVPGYPGGPGAGPGVPGPGGPGGGGPGGSPGVPGYPGGPGAGPGGPGGGGPGGGPGGGGSRGGGAPGAPRSGGGFGPGSGPGGGAGGGPGGGSGGGAGAGLGAGKGSGAATPGGANTGAGGAGAGGPGGGAARGGAAGAGGRGMMGGMPMGGMGRGGGGDEEEHQTKYLIEEDGHELFGTDQPTAPPVIGE